MAFRAVRVALLLSTLPIAGCGTVANLVKPGPELGSGKRPFGGVGQDVWCIQKAANGEFGIKAHPRSESEHYPQVALMLLCAADLPFSLAADVVTWPYTALYSYINQPTPYPPVTLINPPVTQPLTDGQPIPPLETLPEPRKLP